MIWNLKSLVEHCSAVAEQAMEASDYKSHSINLDLLMVYGMPILVTMGDSKLTLFASDESDDGMMAITAHEALRDAIRARGET